MKLQTMIDQAMNVADWMKSKAFIFEKSCGYAVVDEVTSEKLKQLPNEYKLRAVVYPKP